MSEEEQTPSPDPSPDVRLHNAITPEQLRRVMRMLAARAVARGVSDELRLEYADRVLMYAGVVMKTKAFRYGMKEKKTESVTVNTVMPDDRKSGIMLDRIPPVP